MRPLLLLILGEAPESVSRAHGTFAAWYERAAGETLTVVDGRGGASVNARDYAGVLISGSAASLAAPEPWMDAAGDLVVQAKDAGVPVLGVCFGHQLVGRTFGATVVPNPRGYEIGTRRVRLTAAGRRDPLFVGLPDDFAVNQSHYDMVDGPLEDVTVLASNEHTTVQSVGVGSHVRGVQFHPEFTGAVMRGYLGARRATITTHDPDELLAAAADCPESALIIQNFRRHFVGRS